MITASSRLIGCLVLLLSSVGVAVEGQQSKFVQPCPDAGGYRGWLGGPAKNHLGHDYRTPAGTDVKAISDGVVWRVDLNVPGFGSEGKPGALIWLKHRLASGHYFYALYGHVTPDRKLRDGTRVEVNQTIATVAVYLDADTKKDLSHLHFGIWNSETMPPVSQLGYGPVRSFTDPVKFLKENAPYSDVNSEVEGDSGPSPRPEAPVRPLKPVAPRPLPPRR